MPQNSKMLIGAIVAAALAFAVYYGLIGQQTANNIQGQANQTLGTAPSSPQAGAPAPQVPSTQTTTPAGAVPPAQSPRP